ncbi:hypothetical protein FOMPIDRAFT_101252 [Fomitopsis schrenkii]|uniref:choline-phosphate cytidylyltransferase n=1 Tax=Fomitopsis schrenkii TaxID=2126942 RepID=S8FFX7_FOMSC|nr:hypothetical protein FOMPIDRAFT_101252 [Fomitopsis schrenkii]
MADTASAQQLAPRRQLHSKRSFGTKHAMQHPHHRGLHSPAAYDASEEDNDPTTDDAASAVGVPAPRTAPASSPVAARKLTGAARARAALLAADEDHSGTDSPTYDGDVESTTTTPGARDHPRDRTASEYGFGYESSASTSTGTEPALPTAPVSPSIPASTSLPLPLLLSGPTEPPPSAIARDAFDPAKLTPADIQAFVARAVAGTDTSRPYRINAPPADRPARIYADGVYDLFHFGHALQLRQAKLSFPPIPVSRLAGAQQAEVGGAEGSTPTIARGPLDHAPPQGTVPGVYLLVGVNSDEQCDEHKNMAVMNHAERCEAVRHCRWVDEVVPEAPWVITEEFLEKYQIDYVAHDEDPYVSAGIDDVYGYCKSQGRFLPTRRTPGVSTSELLERIVSRYRARVFDKKLRKMGHGELAAEGSDYDDSRPGSVRASRAGSPGPGPR